MANKRGLSPLLFFCDLKVVPGRVPYSSAVARGAIRKTVPGRIADVCAVATHSIIKVVPGRIAYAGAVATCKRYVGH